MEGPFRWKDKENKRSIRRQIFGLVMGSVLLAILSNVILGLFFMHQTRAESEKAVIAQMEDQLYQLAVSSADMTDEELLYYFDFVRVFSRYAEEIYRSPERFRGRPVFSPSRRNNGRYALKRYYASEDIDRQEVEDEMERLSNMESVFAPFMALKDGVVADIYIATKTGVFLSYNNNGLTDLEIYETEGDYFNYYDRDWYQNALERGSTSLTSIYEDSFHKGAMVSCSRPVRQDGEIVAVLSMDILVRDLQSDLLNLNIPNGAYVFMIDGQGKAIVDTRLPDGVEANANIYDGRYGSVDIIDSIVNAREGVKKSGDSIYYAFSPVELTDWILCVAIPEEKVLEPLGGVEEIFRFAILNFMVLSMMFCGALLYVTAHYSDELIRPIQELRRDVNIISSGNLDWKVEIRHNDEIGELGEAFNRMTGDLRNYIADLTKVTAEKERIGAELDVAAKIQRDMLICEFPAFPERKEFDLYATMRPAKAVGGDFYDFFMVDDNHLALAIADVSGKGIPAALFMMMSMLPLRDYAKGKSSPAEVLRKVNDILASRNDESMFVTIWLGFLDLATGRLVCSNAGHEYPTLREPDGQYYLMKDPHGLAAGIMEGVPYKDYEIQMKPGGDLFVYSDGLPEGLNEEGVQFGTEGILRTLNASEPALPKETLEEMQAAQDAFAGSAPQFDDITMLGLHWYGPVQEP